MSLACFCLVCPRTQGHQMRGRISLQLRRYFAYTPEEVSLDRPSLEERYEMKLVRPLERAPIIEQSSGRRAPSCSRTVNGRWSWDERSNCGSHEEKSHHVKSSRRPLVFTGSVWKTLLTLNTDASNRSFPDASASRGLSRFNVLKRPSGDLKSGMPACTEMPAPRRGFS